MHGDHMYQKILLAYDGSDSGQEALLQGADLALLTKARIYLLAAIFLEPGVVAAEAAAPSGLPWEEREAISKVLMEGAESLRKMGLAVETFLRVGSPTEQIDLVAREVDADLIVIGHRDRTPFARWWGGSVGMSLLGHAHCSILIAVGQELSLK
ncbi:MAG: universal stress protein [Alphaproteobacteria bacterium]